MRTEIEAPARYYTIKALRWVFMTEMRDHLARERQALSWAQPTRSKIADWREDAIDAIDAAQKSEWEDEALNEAAIKNANRFHQEMIRLTTEVAQAEADSGLRVASDRLYEIAEQYDDEALERAADGLITTADLGKLNDDVWMLLGSPFPDDSGTGGCVSFDIRDGVRVIEGWAITHTLLIENDTNEVFVRVFIPRVPQTDRADDKVLVGAPTG